MYCPNLSSPDSMNKPTSSYMFLPSVLQPKKELALTDRFDEVVNAVCAVHGVKKEYLFRKYKKKPPEYISIPRHQSMYLIFELIRDEAGDRLGHKTIADYFGMERTAVTHAISVIKAKTKPNKIGTVPDQAAKHQVDAIIAIYRKSATLEEINNQLKQPARRTLLKQIRAAVVLSQKAFAAAVGISYNAYVLLEKGEGFVTEDHIGKAVTYFNNRKEQIIKALDDVSAAIHAS